MRKVSIIIPVYNVEKFIGDCLDSAVSQTIEDKEIICIDDGSLDCSYQILKQYQYRYPYIKVFRQENKGAGEARNLGLQKAAGKYISFLDADDFYLDSEALEKMVDICEKNQLQLCAGLIRMYDGSGTIEDFYLHRDCFEKGRNPNGKILTFKERQDDYGFTSYIFSMDVIKKNKISFPTYRRYEDPPFLLKYMISIKEYMILPIEFYGYRYLDAAVKRKGTYIEDILKGIRDNAWIAQRYQLNRLKEILAYRISTEYSSWIINGVNDEVLLLLCEIQKALFGTSCREKETADVQESSFEIVRSIAAGNLKGKNLGRYFEENGITSVAVYGLGHYGKMSVSEIQKSGNIKIYGIDQKIQQLEGIEINTLDEINKKCNTVIVTPAKGNYEIVNHIKETWNGNVWGLYELVHKVESGNENAD